MKRQHVVAMFNKKSEKGFAVRNWLKTVHAPMQFAFNNGWLTDDPTLRVKNLSGNTSGYMTWLEPQIAQYRAHHQLGTVAHWPSNCCSTSPLGDTMSRFKGGC